MDCYRDLTPGETIYRIPETVVSVERLTRLKVPGHPSAGRIYTGQVKLVTRLASVESEELVDGTNRVHTDEGCT